MRQRSPGARRDRFLAKRMLMEACVPGLGAKADALCAAAGDVRLLMEKRHEPVLAASEEQLDALLRSIYAKQLRTARAAAVQAPGARS